MANRLLGGALLVAGGTAAAVAAKAAKRRKEAAAIDATAPAGPPVPPPAVGPTDAAVGVGRTDASPAERAAADADVSPPPLDEVGQTEGPGTRPLADDDAPPRNNADLPIDA